MNSLNLTINENIVAVGGFDVPTTIAKIDFSGVQLGAEKFVGWTLKLYASAEAMAEDNFYIPDGVRKGFLRNMGGKISENEFVFETNTVAELTTNSIDSIKTPLKSTIANLLNLNVANIS